MGGDESLLRKHARAGVMITLTRFLDTFIDDAGVYAEEVS